MSVCIRVFKSSEKLMEVLTVVKRPTRLSTRVSNTHKVIKTVITEVTTELLSYYGSVMQGFKSHYY